MDLWDPLLTRSIKLLILRESPLSLIVKYLIKADFPLVAPCVTESCQRLSLPPTCSLEISPRVTGYQNNSFYSVPEAFRIPNFLSMCHFMFQMLALSRWYCAVFFSFSYSLYVFSLMILKFMNHVPYPVSPRYQAQDHVYWFLEKFLLMKWNLH